MKTFYICALFLFINTTLIGQSPIELIKEHSKEFPEYTELAVAIVQEDKISYYGIIKKGEQFEEKSNAQAVFEIGSITKVFTSTLLAEQVTLGKLKLDDCVKKHLGFKLKGKPKITLKQLSNHTSGLPRLPENLYPLMINNPSNPYKAYTAEKLKEYCTKELKLEGSVGEQYTYSNLGAGLLGFALAHKAKKSYEELLQEIIFKPYKMIHSTTNQSLVKENLVLGLDPYGEVTSNWDMTALSAAGDVLSSVEDLSKFAIANFDTNDKKLALQQEKTYSVNKNMDMALSWHIVKNKSGNDIHFHNGGTGGYTSSMSLDIEDKHAVIILSNVSAFHPKMGNIDVLGFKLMELLKKK